MHIIIGLGNPGKQYAHTRHNAGFMAIDYIHEKCASSTWEHKKKLDAEISECLFNGEKIILAKPLTFMNVSGNAVQNILSWYKSDPQHLIVIHDDTDLVLGKIKIQTNRGSAGHNGVNSIIEMLGTANFTRARIGVRPAESTDSAMDMVLKNLNKDDKKIMEQSFQTLWEALQTRW